MADTDGGKEDMEMTELRSAVERLQAEMAWVKLMLSKQKPSEAPHVKTSPPTWLATATALAVAIIPAIILTKPWG